MPQGSIPKPNRWYTVVDVLGALPAWDLKETGGAPPGLSDTAVWHAWKAPGLRSPGRYNRDTGYSLFLGFARWFTRF
ncbi:hypothetical protein [Leeuwenhoekiella aestuarii]|uniref:hypothetical protein n=1 Tax=Leeuwenhoekiella aestuarii TaxID=2249426 RepID=UPI0030B80A63